MQTRAVNPSVRPAAGTATVKPRSNRIGQFITGPLLVLALAFGMQVISISLPAPAQAKSDPNFDDLLKKGNQQLAVGETDKAIELFQKTVKKYPQSAACHTALGKALKRRGKLSEAKAEFKCACEMESNFPDAFYELGALQESDKEWDPAAQSFTRYLELSPEIRAA